MLRLELSPRLLRLSNPIAEYAWGSDQAIFDVFSWSRTGRPAAELWLGAHELSPSLTGTSGHQDLAPTPAYYLPGQDPAGHVPLGDMIRAYPDAMLGPVVQDEYGPRLPYLLKVLAAAQPLSLQVHPRPHIARAGFQCENALGIDLTSPDRNYKDPSHKPEMLIALTPFEGLCGFRRPRRVLELLGPLSGPTVQDLVEILTRSPNAQGVEQALARTLELRETDCVDELEGTMAAIQAEVARATMAGQRVSRGYLTALDLARQYPGDPGAIVSLLLNRVSLTPGEALYLRAGQIHAYLSGLGIEIMASSDNVLRAGLTPKRVDVPQLMAATDFAPAAPIRPALRAVPGGLTQYRSPAAEFGLIFGQLSGPTLVPQSGPRIVLCLDGRLEVVTALGDSMVLGPGEAVFAPHAVSTLDLSGTASLVVAYVP